MRKSWLCETWTQSCLSKPSHPPPPSPISELPRDYKYVVLFLWHFDRVLNASLNRNGRAPGPPPARMCESKRARVYRNYLRITLKLSILLTASTMHWCKTTSMSACQVDTCRMNVHDFQSQWLWFLPKVSDCVFQTHPPQSFRNFRFFNPSQSKSIEVNQSQSKSIQVLHERNDVWSNMETVTVISNSKRKLAILTMIVFDHSENHVGDFIISYDFNHTQGIFYDKISDYDFRSRRLWLFHEVTQRLWFGSQKGKFSSRP